MLNYVDPLCGRSWELASTKSICLNIVRYPGCPAAQDPLTDEVYSSCVLSHALVLQLSQLAFQQHNPVAQWSYVPLARNWMPCPPPALRKSFKH